LPADFAVAGVQNQVSMYLLVPAGTDLRDNHNLTGSDVVVVPAGSGRGYFVDQVDDLGKGFANEHRFALLSKAGAWPTPIP
jgi:hypothetical protein